MTTVGESPLLSIAGLEVRFGGHAPAVRQVDLAVHTGQTVAIVGESGS
ncbi:MAG: oligopeptide transport system ATP-binding protein oppD, partial [Mycobacterium sp.]|nr:oligopeptide transport system ATP-binding protein oppD [Mycobacterium sp.]